MKKKRVDVVGDRVLTVMLVLAVFIGGLIGLIIGLTLSEPSLFE